MNERHNRSHTISSRNHIAIKRIRALQSQAERERTGLFYGEGMRFIIEAVKRNAQIETLVVCPPLLAHGSASNLIAKLKRSGVPVLEVSPEVIHSLAQVDDPQGLGAVVRQKWRALEQAKLDGKLCWLALDAVQSPGNLGSMIRTASAVGAAGFIFLDGMVDPYNSATVRAAMGATFTQRFVQATPQQLAEWKQARRWQLIGTSPHSAMDYRQADYASDPVILMLGSERKGLSSDLLALCDTIVSIPMSGKTDSLNIAVAAGVVLYEILYQRGAR